MTLLVIDVLYILYELGLTRRINNKVVDVITEDLNINDSFYIRIPLMLTPPLILALCRQSVP